MIKDQILADIKEAMKSGDAFKRDTLRMVNSSFKQIEVDERVVLSDERVLAILQSEVKRRSDSVEAYRNGGREDLAQKELDEIRVISAYLPRQLSDEELCEALGGIISRVGKNMGAVMKAAKEELGASADGKRISAAAKALLG